MSGDTPSSALPEWSLASIYPAFDSAKRQEDLAELETTIEELGAALEPAESGASTTSEELLSALRLWERCLDLTETLKTHAYAAYSTDTTNADILGELNRLETFDVAMHRLRARLRKALAAGGSAVLAAGPEEYRYVLGVEARLGTLQMPVEMEELAADLARSGAELWSRLQDSLGATLSTDQTTVVQLRSLAHHPEREVRRTAFEKEISLWRGMEIPLAHAINGVKGFAVVLDKRRGFEDSLERAVIESRMSKESFEGLIGACETALPVFHRYLNAKARALGQEKLAFFDIFAPVSRAAAEETRYSFAEARELICREFRNFSEDLGAFAESVFEKSWIDAKPRPGKVGGAYCVSFSTVGESRILCNFDGSISSVSTVAHEIGHAYHQEVLTEMPALLRQYPMTLAETASIFCENLVYRALIRELPSSRRLTAIEAFLQDANQVIVDILSRFRFERELFRLRGDHEVSPQALCSLMSRFQQETYGEALDPEFLHPYMWAVKGHYYNHDLSFYNFPYAFGLLFSLALLAEYDDATTADFSRRYRRLLEITGAASVEAVVGNLGLDTGTAQFWRRGIDAIERHVEEFEELL